MLPVLLQEKLVLSMSENTRQVRWNIKGMLLIFIECEGVVHEELFPLGQMVN
jgi:hypothetical protein